MADKTPTADSTAPQQTTTWPELAIGLYDKLTGRDAEIEYDFGDDFELYVPSGTGPEATHAKWKMKGKITIRTRDPQHGGAADRD